MLSLRTLLASTLCLWQTVTATPLKPSEDPWYDQPSNIASYSPGQLVRARQIQPNLNPFIPLGADVKVEAAYQYLYRTTDSLGNAVGAVTTLFIPYDADPTKLLAYQTAYDTAQPDCSPSYALQDGSGPEGLSGLSTPNSTMSTDVPFIAAALNQGWYLLTTDYEGLEAQFTAGIQAGHATLDSVRVVLSEGPAVGLSTSPRYALWGYSGGSLASAWAAELQPSYAPELNFVGAALGGTVPNVSSVLETINNSSFSGLAFGGIYGMSKAYANLSQWLSEDLLPEKADIFYEAAYSCLAGERQVGGSQDMYTFFVDGADSFRKPIPQSVLQWSGQMGHYGTPTIPLFIYKAVGDEVGPVEDTDWLVDLYCSRGARIEYHRDWIGEHVSEAITGSASALSWVAKRLNGESVAAGCKTKQVLLSSLDLSTLVLLGAEIFAFLETIVGGLLGL